MDAESEAVILDTIRELAQSATVIMITHRMANAVTADQVVVFDHGRVAETGTHAALMARGGVYADLFRAQQVIEHVGHRSIAGASVASAAGPLPARRSRLPKSVRLGLSGRPHRNPLPVRLWSIHAVRPNLPRLRPALRPARPTQPTAPAR